MPQPYGSSAESGANRFSPPPTAAATRGAELVEQLVEALGELLKRARAERDPEL